MSLTIKKKDVSKDQLITNVSKTWLSNGHWAIKIDHLDPVKNAEHLAVADPNVSDKGMEQLIPKNLLKTYKITGDIQNTSSDLDPNEDLVKFVTSTSDDPPIWIKRKYVNMFDLWQGIESTGPNNPTIKQDDDGPWVVVMPFRA